MKIEHFFKSVKGSSITRLILGMYLFLPVCLIGENLTIALASNMAPLIPAFSKDLKEIFPDQNFRFIQGASGALESQISGGLQVDILLSADFTGLKELHAAGRSSLPPVPVCLGQLVLYSRMLRDMKNWKTLWATSGSKELIAIPNPKIAPFGTAALEFLLYEGLSPGFNSRLVYGQSVVQSFQFAQYAASWAFTSATMVLNPEVKPTPIEFRNWIKVPRESYSPLVHGMLVISQENRSGIQAFQDYILGERGQSRLLSAGYLPWKG